MSLASVKKILRHASENGYAVSVVDTTGAGDVFHGAFIYGLLQGWTAKRCARWSSAVSAIKVTRLGGRAGIPDAAMTEKFLETGEIDGGPLDARARWYADAIGNTLKETGRCGACVIGNLAQPD